MLPLPVHSTGPNTVDRLGFFKTISRVAKSPRRGRDSDGHAAESDIIEAVFIEQGDKLLRVTGVVAAPLVQNRRARSTLRIACPPRGCCVSQMICPRQSADMQSLLFRAAKFAKSRPAVAALMFGNLSSVVLVEIYIANTAAPKSPLRRLRCIIGSLTVYCRSASLTSISAPSAMP
jgi:hypothetical protein